jgi:hypothetical protein
MSGDGQGLAPARAQWTAEVEVSPALAAELIAGQFPELGSGPVTPLATGWDNTVVLVDGEWLFRLAEFLAAYGRPVGPERELAARICALSVGASLTEYAADQGQATLLRECRAGLARVMAD